MEGVRPSPTLRELAGASRVFRNAIYDSRSTIHGEQTWQHRTLTPSCRSRSDAVLFFLHQRFTAAWAALGTTARSASSLQTTSSAHGGAGWVTSATTRRGLTQATFSTAR